MKFKKLVILDKVVMTNKQEEELRNLAENVLIYNDTPKNNEEAIQRIGDADAIITSWTTLSKEIFDVCSNPKYVGMWSTGYSWVDINYAKKRSITTTNVPGYATESVAELVFGQLLSLLRKTRQADEFVRMGRFNFEPFLGEELMGKTIGIIGLGRIGSRVAEIAKTFDMNIIYYSRTRKPEQEKKGIRYVDLETLIKDSDIITLHTNVSKEFIGEKELEMMKEGVVIVNTQVEGVVNEGALTEKIKGGKVRAVLDCLVDKTVRKEFRKNKDNVILTPHIGFYTKQALWNLTQICIENAKSYLKGKVENKVE